MEAFYERMIEIGEKLGLSGEKLLQFVEEKYERQKAVEERESRLKERNLEKEFVEKELEKERIRAAAAGAADLPRVGHSHEVKAKIPKLPPFDDNRESIEDYLQRFERYANSVGWAPEDRALHLSALLKGKALAVYSRLSPEQATNYDTLKGPFISAFN